MASFSTRNEDYYVTLLKDEEAPNVSKFSRVKVILCSIILVLIIALVTLTIYTNTKQEKHCGFIPTDGEKGSSTSRTSPSPTTTIPDICKTERGRKMDAPCIFPFVYKGFTYNNCTNMRHHSLWCSTKVSATGIHIDGNRGICNSNCPIYPTSDWTKTDQTCYKFITEICRKGCSYTEAKGLCAAEGGILAEPRTANVLSKLSRLSAKSHPGYSWILGLHDRGQENNFVWDSDNSSMELSRQFWAKWEPNNGGHGGEDCVEMESGGKLNDVPCEDPIGMPVCQKNGNKCG